MTTHKRLPQAPMPTSPEPETRPMRAPGSDEKTKPAEPFYPDRRQGPSIDPVYPDRRVAKQSLPQDDKLASTDSMERMERESEVNKVNPKPETHVGPDTVGVGQPPLQAVNQGQSLPQSALTVEKKFEGKSEQFYDPYKAERALQKKDRTNAGGTKTDS